MASEDNLGNQWVKPVFPAKPRIREHKFSWSKAGRNQEQFFSCCAHTATNTGRPSDKKWSLTGKGTEISTHRSSAAAKEAAMKLHEEGDHAW